MFILEGRLTGLWAKELLRAARETNQGYDNIFDLQEVFYVDSEGEKTLRLLGGQGSGSSPSRHTAKTFAIGSNSTG